MGDHHAGGASLFLSRIDSSDGKNENAGCNEYSRDTDVKGRAREDRGQARSDIS